MGIRDLFKSRDALFLQMLVDQSAKTLEAIEELQRYLNSADRSLARRVKEIETEADELRRAVNRELNRTFITPFDPEDIYALSRTIDEVIDYTATTAEEMEILGIRADDYLKQMITLELEGAREVHLAIIRLKDHPNAAGDHALRARSLENRVEQLYRRAVADTLSSAQNVADVVKALKYREVYRHVSNAADRFAEAADVVNHIVVKVT
jgi:predicted phosphate transport protein (TIGR00153 family)